MFILRCWNNLKEVWKRNRSIAEDSINTQHIAFFYIVFKYHTLQSIDINPPFEDFPFEDFPFEHFPFEDFPFEDLDM